VHQHVQLQLLHLREWLRLLLLEREQRHLRRRRPRVAVLVLRSRHRLQGLRRRPATCIPASIAAGPSTIAAIAAAVAAAAPAAPIAAIAATAAAALPTGHGCPVHQHVLRLLLLWVLRQVHVLRGRSG